MEEVVFVLVVVAVLVWFALLVWVFPNNPPARRWQDTVWRTAPFILTLLYWAFTPIYAHSTHYAPNPQFQKLSDFMFFGCLAAILAIHARLIIKESNKLLFILYLPVNLFAFIMGSLWIYFASGGYE